LRSILWPTMLGPTPTTGRPLFVSCQMMPDSDDSLTLGGVRSMIEEMLSCYSIEETNAVTLGLLGTRLNRLACRRVRLAPSTVTGGGMGVFATRTLEEGELITLYPGDSLLHFADVATNEAGAPTADKVQVSFGSHVSLGRRRAQTQSAESLIAARAYELPSTEQMSLMGDPTLTHDLAYVGHMLNDCSTCRSTSELASYAIATATYVNAVHLPIHGCHFASVTTRRVEEGEELFVSYGPGYWLSRQGGISGQEIRAAEEALGVEIRSGGALCAALQAALEAQPGGTGRAVVANVAFGVVSEPAAVKCSEREAKKRRCARDEDEWDNE